LGARDRIGGEAGNQGEEEAFVSERHSGMVRKHQTRNLEIPGSLRAPE
jgi:hypothetical protein